MVLTPFPVVALVLGICFLSTTAHAAYMFNGKGFRQVDVAKLLDNIKPLRTPVGRAVSRFRCARGDAILAVGKEWTERCRQCRCTEAGIVCTSQYTCPQPYNSMQEITCAKWSENQCCCEAEGCVLANGTLVAVNEDMPFDPERPCASCTCTGGNRTRCRLMDFVHGCGMKCVDGVRVRGQCCPHCPNGRTCFMPDEETRRLSKAELPSLRIVRESSPVVLRTGTPNQVICTCEAGKMVANCRPMSSGLGIRIKQIPLVV